MVLVPTVQWVQQDPGTDPSGVRNLNTTGFIKQLGTGAGQVLDFGTINNTLSGVVSDTRLAYARISDLGDASGVFNMRFFLNSVSDFGVGTTRFLERKALHFLGAISLTENNEDTPTNVPISSNYSGTITEPEFPLGKPWMSGILDNDAGQYVYLAILVGSDVPVGTYGGAGAGTFRYRLIYDFS
jgi:hypothetical protein